MLEGLMALCALPGISGHEGPVRAYLKEALSPLGLEVFTDPMGNLYAHRPGPGPRVMVAAHMDEVGMVVRGHREDGTLAYAAAGIVGGPRPPCPARGHRLQGHPPANRRGIQNAHPP